MKHDRISIEAACTRDDKHREVVSLLCEVRQGTRPWQTVRLQDISRKGFGIGWLPGATTDHPVRVRIPGIHLLTAHIRWQQGKAVGCEFTEPLHIAVFEHLVAQLR